jgi:PD-(D/E)XK nuclease superfamily protein
MGKNKKTEWIKGCKERGEWAELCFMARAKGLGMGVLKPYGDSGRYDVAVESGGPISRVQVKSTIYCRRGGEYSLNVMGPGRKRYRRGTVDFFAVWVIPIGEWYIIPYEAMGKRLTMHFTPGSKRSKWMKYREAWDLLRVIEIQACVDPEDGPSFCPTTSEAAPRFGLR